MPRTASSHCRFSSSRSCRTVPPPAPVVEAPPAPPCIFVLFGATGDLAARKIAPALYNLMRDGLLGDNIAVLGIARRGRTDEEFRNEMLKAAYGAVAGLAAYPVPSLCGVCGWPLVLPVFAMVFIITYDVYATARGEPSRLPEF